MEVLFPFGNLTDDHEDDDLWSSVLGEPRETCNSMMLFPHHFAADHFLYETIAYCQQLREEPYRYCNNYELFFPYRMPTNIRVFYIMTMSADLSGTKEQVYHPNKCSAQGLYAANFFFVTRSRSRQYADQKSARLFLFFSPG